MANPRLTFILVLQFISVFNIFCANDFNENINEFYRPQIHHVVKYLNQDVNRVYNYKYATLISAQNKNPAANDLVLDIELECRRVDLCITDVATCTATVQYNAETSSYDIIQGVSCHPKVRINLSKDDSEKPHEEEKEKTVESYHKELEDETAENPFHSEIMPCDGCPIEINTNAEGIDVLSNVALKHIESEHDNKYILVKVLRAQSQVVAGIKYTLLLEVISTACSKTIEPQYIESCVPDTNNPSEICEVTYFQQPWINHDKHIIANNCTHMQQFSVQVQETKDKNDLDNEIDANYNYGQPLNAPDIGGIMNPVRMREVESQVVYQKPVENDTIVTTTESRLSESQKSAIDGLLGIWSGETRKKRAAKDDNNNDDNNNDSSSSSSSSSDEDDNNHEDKKEKNRKSKHHHDDKDDNNNDNNDDDSSSSSSSSSEENNNDNDNDNHIEHKKKHRKRSKRNVDPNNTSESKESKESSEETPVQQNIDLNRAKRNVNSELTKVSPEEKTFVLNLANMAVNELDAVDEDNHKRLVLQILGAKKIYDNGYVYHITMKVGVSACPEDSLKDTDLTKPYDADDCRYALFENLTKICKMQIHVNNEKKNPKVLKSHCQDIKKDISEYVPKPERSNRTHRDKRAGGIPGGINDVDTKSPETMKRAKEFLEQLSAEKGLTEKLEIVEILSASQQVVAGLLYRYNIKIKQGEKIRVCYYEIWQRNWIKPPREVTEKCEDEQTENKYRFRRSISSHPLIKDESDTDLFLFKRYIEKFNKNYDNSDFKRRYKIFKQNMKKIYYLNENEQGTATYGPTIFADMTEEEFKNYKGLNLELRNPNQIPFPSAVIPNIDIPKEFDWRKKGVITEVKNQGSCGSCWAFSVTGNIEGLNAIKTGNLVEFSEQELVDCDSMDNGCGGGYMDNAYRAIEKLGGLETEKDYPYEAENDKCIFNKSLTRVQISGAVNISHNETDMAKWLVKNGPISIGINANAMQFYMGGVSHPYKFMCSPKNIDHGVLIVGYGVHKYPLFNKTMPFWIVKNSWGEGWGEQGYYRVYRGDGTCGLNQMPESAIL